METTILGQEISFPIGISPTGFHKLAHVSGELAMAKGKYSACILNLYNEWNLNSSLFLLKYSLCQT